MSVSREQLLERGVQLLKALPTCRLKTIVKLMEYLVEDDTTNLRRLEEHLANPIYDDEPLTEEERLAIEEAKKDIAKGDVYTFKDLANAIWHVPKGQTLNCQYDPELKQFTAQISDLNLVVNGDTREEIAIQIQEDIYWLWKEYSESPDEELTEDSRNLKKRLEALMKEVKP